MIGAMDASLEETRKDGGGVKLEVQGMHVAGIRFVNRGSSSDDGSRCVMWSASLRRGIARLRLEQRRRRRGDG
jgi:hypothetical protein